PMPTLAAATAKAARAGLEFAAGVPGTVGGSVVGNAGAFGGEVNSGLLSAEVIDRQGRRQTMAAADCAFGYRDSVFKTVRDGWAIVSALFRTTSEAPRSGEPACWVGRRTRGRPNRPGGAAWPAPSSIRPAPP